MPLNVQSLPPPPIGADQGDYVWLDWYTKFQKVANATIVEVNTIGTDLDTLEDVVAGLSGGGSGIAIYATNPATGNEGDVIFNSTDGKLYRWHSGAWTAAVPAVDITGTLTDSQLAAIAAAKITGTITSTQIADGSIQTPKLAAGAVTTNELAANAVTAAKIAAGEVTTAKLAANAVTANEIATNAVTSDKIIANAITAGKILAGEIGTTHLAADAITTEKLFIKGRGRALNDDPSMRDASAWTLVNSTSIVFGTTAAGKVGDYYAANTTGGSDGLATSRRFAVDPNKQYRLTANLFADHGNDRNMYIYIRMWDNAGVELTNADTGWGGAFAGYVYGSTPTPTGQFNRFGDTLGAGTPRPIPANVSEVAVGVWFQYSGAGSTNAYQAAQDIRLEESVDTSLVVDGSITADKLTVSQLSAITADLGTVTAGEIIVGSSPAISGTTMTGSGTHLYSDGKFTMGNSTKNINFNGTQATLNGFSTGISTTISGFAVTQTETSVQTITGITDGYPTFVAFSGQYGGFPVSAANMSASLTLRIKDDLGTVISAGGILVYAPGILINSGANYVIGNAFGVNLTFTPVSGRTYTLYTYFTPASGSTTGFLNTAGTASVAGTVSISGTTTVYQNAV